VAAGIALGEARELDRGVYPPTSTRNVALFGFQVTSMVLNEITMVSMPSAETALGSDVR
jgi:hypothetical protein